MQRRPGTALLGLLLGAFASSAARAGEPVDLTGHSTFGEARFHASIAWAAGGRQSERGDGSLFLRLGPDGFCSDVVPWGQFSLRLFEGGSLLGVEGELEPAPRGVGLDPDPVALRDALAERVAALCEEEHGAVACAERLGALEPRLGRTRLSLKLRQRRERMQVRLRGRLELLFVDPATERAEVRASFAFRDAGGLPLFPAANVTGVCLITIPFGD